MTLLAPEPEALDEPLDHAGVEAVTPLRRVPPLIVERLGDLHETATLIEEPMDPLLEVVEVTQLLEARDRPDQLSPGPVPPDPVYLRVDLFRLSNDGDNDAFE